MTEDVQQAYILPRPFGFETFWHQDPWSFTGDSKYKEKQCDACGLK